MNESNNEEFKKSNYGSIQCCYNDTYKGELFLRNHNDKTSSEVIESLNKLMIESILNIYKSKSYHYVVSCLLFSVGVRSGQSDVKCCKLIKLCDIDLNNDYKTILDQLYKSYTGLNNSLDGKNKQIILNYENKYTDLYNELDNLITSNNKITNEELYNKCFVENKKCIYPDGVGYVF